ncbi:hypothetical protein [Modestobacter sp. VKM Ac-2978]|uniref:hypothetical protein n=1 Tax=Modestobacter sp. VKM Ac-2978 TaxID=3004132 RepID=UPI0022AAE4E3|nr:hypothetical protein [Modestobacter sp. VKM Ac-2978]MCZ2846608.1 hypothetical protein [Modestobacter sp. VKM Ac-2978]
MTVRRTVILIALLTLTVLHASPANACESLSCAAPDPEVGIGGGAVMAGYIDGSPGEGLRRASLSGPLSEYEYLLVRPCDFTDSPLGGCQSGIEQCPEMPERIVTEYVILAQRLVQEDYRPLRGLAPDPSIPVGQPYGGQINEGISCVDVTDLNPPPSPAEVFRYFETLPLPQLTTRQQPPGEALVGLPVIFFTDSPTTQTFTVDIRGFDVLITANAVSYTWRTGDGTTLTTTDPGAPYPDHTISHEYSSGTYTASLTTTWGATYSVDGGVSADVPGTTTTDGAPATFTVRQARSVLTSPYD